MIRTEKLRFCKGDWLAVGLVAALALAIMLCFLSGNQTSSGQAEIFLNGESIKTVDLTQDQTFVISDRYSNVITVTDGVISITQSDCPGQDCVHSGGISTLGRVIVCLPNGLEIRVIAQTGDVDFVVG